MNAPDDDGSPGAPNPPDPAVPPASPGPPDPNGPHDPSRPRGALAPLRAWIRRHSTHVLVVAVVAAIVGGVTPVITGSLLEDALDEPQPGCPGAACDGKDPQREGCAADATSWEPARDNPVVLQVRYSERCAAVWARIIRGEEGDQVTIHVRDGSSWSGVVAYGHDKFTPMASVGETFHAKACATPTTSEPRTGTWTKYCGNVTEKTAWAQ